MPGTIRRRALAALACGVLVLTSFLTFSAVVDAAASPAAKVVNSTRVSDRMRELTVSSPAMKGQVKVRLLLPSKWKARGGPDWPTLMLLHGGADDYRSWSTKTDVEAFTANTDALIVMPDGGKDGLYSDWRSDSFGYKPQWETFHTVELPRLLQQKYRANGKFAVAGLSMGGFGALKYCGRHPDLFSGCASYSGAGHLLKDPWRAMIIPTGFGHNPWAVWGDPRANKDVWRQNDPYELASAMVGKPLYLSAGNGNPGSLDGAGARYDDGENALLQQSTEFANRIRQLGGAVTTDFYGNGTHSWGYWQRSLHTSLPLLLDSMK
jgi:S-formylglutathione hydrolase FrmB